MKMFTNKETLIDKKFSQLFPNINPFGLFELQLNIGNGGEDAVEIAQVFFLSYRSFISIFDNSFESDYKKLSIKFSNSLCFKILKICEEGITKIIRNHKGKRHTSFYSISLSILNESKIFLKNSDILMESMRASGKGGQHVNKTNSAVKLTYLPLKISVKCSEHRSLHMNQEEGLKILKRKVQEFYDKKHETESRNQYRDLDKTTHGSSYIRTIFFDPIAMLKDHRTNLKMDMPKSLSRVDVQIIIVSTLDSFLDLK